MLKFAPKSWIVEVPLIVSVPHKAWSSQSVCPWVVDTPHIKYLFEFIGDLLDVVLNNRTKRKWGRGERARKHTCTHTHTFTSAYTFAWWSSFVPKIPFLKVEDWDPLGLCSCNRCLSKISQRLPHISREIRCMRSVSMDPPGKPKQPKSLDFEKTYCPNLLKHEIFVVFMMQRLVAKLEEDAELLRAYHEQKELMAAQITLERKLFDSEKQDRVAMMERAHVTQYLLSIAFHVFCPRGNPSCIMDKKEFELPFDLHYCNYISLLAYESYIIVPCRWNINMYLSLC